MQSAGSTTARTGDAAATPGAVVRRAADGAWRGHAALLVVQTCFGLFPLFAKLASDDFAPRALAVWRIAVGAAVLCVAAAAVHGRAALPARRDLGRIAVLALLGVVLNQVLALEGIARSTSTNAGLMMTLIPVFTFALAGLARQERFAPIRAVGLAIALAGALVLQFGQGVDTGAGTNVLLGNALMALNCLSYAGFLVLARTFLGGGRGAGAEARSEPPPPLALIAWVYAASVVTLPFLAVGVDVLPEHVSSGGWWALGLLLLFPTVLAYLLNTYALSRVPASVTAIYIYLQPLIAGVAGAFVLGERPVAAMALAAPLMFVGIALVTRGRRRPR